MIRHIVTWNFKEGLSASEQQETALKIKAILEALKGRIEGLSELKVYIDLLPSSDRAIIISSLLVSEAALAAYQNHPEHQQASAFIKTVTQDRVCVDYVE